MHKTVQKITDDIRARSNPMRAEYLKLIDHLGREGPNRTSLSCSNLAHGVAACSDADKDALAKTNVPNLAIVSAYNDMLSAHQPYETYPALIKKAAASVGAVAQFAGGVPAMCDGVTQNQPGMELSLFSRDVIAMATAVALSHNMFDAAVCLGICDKIVPGLVIGSLSFGHLPVVFIPAGPMPSGLSNKEKAAIRQQYAEGNIGDEELLEAEMAAYHAPGTCTFYGTANSNQMLMEVMGLHIPGAAFVNPGTPLRDMLTERAVERALEMSAAGNDYRPIGHVIDERAMVNAIVGLLATGGSTNHTLHLVAMAKAAGITLTMDDFDALSDVVPLLARIYPNGSADVNHFRDAGGLSFVIRELLGEGLLHEDIVTVSENGFTDYTSEPDIEDGKLIWREAPAKSGDDSIVRPASNAFSATGGLKVLHGDLGTGVSKISAVPEDRHVIEAPVMVFHTQEDCQQAFKDGALHRDVICVLRFQGPGANGMPELHKLTTPLGVLQDLGYRVALVTDGRMSGASGKVPSAIHVTPEAATGGPIAKLQDGDIMRLDLAGGRIEILVGKDEWSARAPAPQPPAPPFIGIGRDIFAMFRGNVGAADQGAGVT